MKNRPWGGVVFAALLITAAAATPADSRAAQEPRSRTDIEQMTSAIAKARDCLARPEPPAASPAWYDDQEARIACLELAVRLAPEAKPRTLSWSADEVQVQKDREQARRENRQSVPTAVSRETGVDVLIRRVILENAESSYATIGSGFRLNGDRTDGNILYEGQVFKNFEAREWHFGDNDFWLDVPVRLGVRQFTYESMPVRTPSYNPGVRLFIAPTQAQGEYRDYFSVGVHHYSNGQDGVSTLPDGRVNTRNGSFNTNYVEAAGHRVGPMGAFTWARIGLRQHFIGTFEAFQRDQYEKGSVAVQGRTKDHSIGGLLPGTWHMLFTGAAQYGRRYVVKNDVNASVNERAGARDNLGFGAELKYHPALLNGKELALYARYDVGYDYYNIAFQNRMNRIQIGVVSTNR